MSRQPRLDVKSAAHALVAGATIRDGADRPEPRRSSLHTDGIVLATLTSRDIDGRTYDSAMGTMMYDRTVGNRIWGNIYLESGPRITEARSQIVDAFLTGHQLALDGKMPDWLCMFDSDMTWPADAPHRLADSAIAHGAKIMGGLCIGGGHDGMFPTLYGLKVEENGEKAPVKLDEWPDGAVVKVGATGAAFLLVHRDVFLKMQQDFRYLPDGTPEPHPWFIEGRRQGNQYGEDVGFCMRAQASGFDVYVDTSVEIGHRKSFEMTVKMWRDNR
jgi:hypothetical protein